MQSTSLLRAGVVVLSIFIASTAQAQAKNEVVGTCKYDRDKLTFAGSELEQAKCLLRKVKPRGHLAAVVDKLPYPLEYIIDHPVAIDKSLLRAYLKKQGIKEADVGGKLDEPLSRGRPKNAPEEFARYFVIHDTSTPNLCEQPDFPANMNGPNWEFNALTKYSDKDPEKKLPTKAHLFITRDGQSIAGVNNDDPDKIEPQSFNRAWRATKLESPDKVDTRAKGMFLHIENVQPRRAAPGPRSVACNPDKGIWYTPKTDTATQKKSCDCINDHIAPNPGLTAPQLDRLALVYIAASVRRAKWMIPAFHAAIDEGISDAHDDPQNFDLADWAGRICQQLEVIGGKCPAVQK
jgi:hypothetical protein